MSFAFCVGPDSGDSVPAHAGPADIRPQISSAEAVTSRATARAPLRESLQGRMGRGIVYGPEEAGIPLNRPSGALEVWLSLLHEGCDALYEVGATRHLALDVGLEVELVVHVAHEALVERPLGLGVGACRALGQATGQSTRFLHQLPVRDHAVD